MSHSGHNKNPKPTNRGSKTVRPVGHRDLRSDPDTSFAGPNVRERSRKPRMLLSSFLGFCLTHSPSKSNTLKYILESRTEFFDNFFNQNEYDCPWIFNFIYHNLLFSQPPHNACDCTIFDCIYY